MPKKRKSKKPVKPSKPKLPRFVYSDMGTDDDLRVFIEIYDRMTKSRHFVILLDDDCDYETAEDDLNAFSGHINEWMERNQDKAMSGIREAFAWANRQAA